MTRTPHDLLRALNRDIEALPPPPAMDQGAVDFAAAVIDGFLADYPAASAAAGTECDATLVDMLCAARVHLAKRAAALISSGANV